MATGIVSTIVAVIVWRVEENRVWQLADECAVSGRCNGWQDVEFELCNRGFYLAPRFLDNDCVRARLDRTCSNAQIKHGNIWRAVLQLNADIRRWAHDQVSSGSNARRTKLPLPA